MAQQKEKCAYWHNILMRNLLAKQNSHDQSKDLASLYCDTVECMYVGKK